MVRNNHFDIKFIQMQKPDEQSKMKRAYLFCTPTDGQPVPYSITNNDLFLDDWNIVL